MYWSLGCYVPSTVAPMGKVRSTVVAVFCCSLYSCDSWPRSRARHFVVAELVANAAHQALARSAHWGRTNVNTSRLYGSAWLAWGHRHLEPRASVGALFETAQSDSDIDLTIQTITWG